MRMDIFVISRLLENNAHGVGSVQQEDCSGVS